MTLLYSNNFYEETDVNCSRFVLFVKTASQIETCHNDHSLLFALDYRHYDDILTKTS